MSNGGNEPTSEQRRRRREMWTVVAAGVAVAAFAIWEIGNPETRGAAGNVLSFLLVNLNIVLLLLVAFLTVRNVLRLLLERRRGIMGSHLRTSMVLAFVTIALFPAVVMVIMSYQFVANGIDDWLGTEVEEALDGAYGMARSYYRDAADDAVAHARALSRDISQGGLIDRNKKEGLRARLSAEQQVHGLARIEVLDANGKPMVVVGAAESANVNPLHGEEEMLAAARRGEVLTRVDSQETTDIIRGSAPIRGGDESLLGVVIVEKVIGESPRAWAAQILDSFREFRRLKLNKQPFKNIYLMTMLLASLVVVFSATWLGLYMARGITDPIGHLAEATREVAAGHLDVALPEEGGDEVATLVRSFNAMTAELKRSRDALEERRLYIENVLANIAAGVVSIGPDGRIGTINPAALQLLGLREQSSVGRSAEEVFEEAGFGEVVTMLREVQLGRLVPGSGINVKLLDQERTLLVTAANLRRGRAEPMGSVLFFEDVSQIQEIQRMEAWREVARRVAHEIKNPLTPIQLSAQRLGRRLSTQLPGGDAELVRECVATIVNEVDGLKQLVNEFSQFAQSASADKTVQDLNPLVEETLPLYRQSRPDISLSFHAGTDLPPVRINRDAVKRSLMNLLDNAVSAVSSNNGSPRAIEVTTRHDADLSRVVLEVGDTGPGIPASSRSRIFEPYFSTKPEGTGLGLAIVASMAADHHAYLRVRPNQPQGTRFVIEFPASSGQHRA
ncbi:MAG TPA: ATP-binding protein [Candidatus Limnocylindrales bacterium]|nr:ATP-binding protein [Candidatus Limnocylindrales bacterium]